MWPGEIELRQAGVEGFDNNKRGIGHNGGPPIRHSQINAGTKQNLRPFAGHYKPTPAPPAKGRSPWRLRRNGDAGICPRVKTICYCEAVRAAARKTTALYDEALEPAGVNVAQYGLLRRIERAGTASLTELGRMAELDRSTVGRNVKVLKRLRLVRLTTAKDQREAAVSLTASGHEAIRRGAPL